MIIGRPPSVCVPIVVIEIWASGFCTHKKKHRWALWWQQFVPKYRFKPKCASEVQAKCWLSSHLSHFFHIPELLTSGLELKKETRLAAISHQRMIWWIGRIPLPVLWLQSIWWRKNCTQAKSDFPLIPRLGNKGNPGSNKIESWFNLTIHFIEMHWDSYLMFRHFLNTLNASVARIFLNIILEKLVIWSNVNVKLSLTIRKITLSSKFTSFLCVHVHNLHFGELCTNNLKWWSVSVR